LLALTTFPDSGGLLVWFVKTSLYCIFS